MIDNVYFYYLLLLIHRMIATLRVEEDGIIQSISPPVSPHSPPASPLLPPGPTRIQQNVQLPPTTPSSASQDECSNSHLTSESYRLMHS